MPIWAKYFLLQPFLEIKHLFNHILFQALAMIAKGINNNFPHIVHKRQYFTISFFHLLMTDEILPNDIFANQINYIHLLQMSLSIQVRKTLVVLYFHIHVLNSLINLKKIFGRSISQMWDNIHFNDLNFTYKLKGIFNIYYHPTQSFLKL